MALQSSFGFTNTTASSTRQVQTYDLGLLDNYALTMDEPTECMLKNTTTPLDVEETVAFRCKNIDKVNTTLISQYPSKVRTGVQYQLQLEAMLSTTDTTNPDFRVDEPIVVQLTVRHQKSGNITAGHVVELIDRATSALMKDSGAYRINDMMRSALKPTQN
jgi:hypothetical protein